MKDDAMPFDNIHYVKAVPIGSVNPNRPLSAESREEQTALLNRCLGGTPRGRIIGRDVTVARYAIGEHVLTMEQTTYHVGFERRPLWLEEQP